MSSSSNTRARPKYVLRRSPSRRSLRSCRVEIYIHVDTATDSCKDQPVIQHGSEHRDITRAHAVEDGNTIERVRSEAQAAVRAGPSLNTALTWAYRCAQILACVAGAWPGLH